MKKFLYFLLATAMLATFGCTGDENTYSVGSPNPNELMPKGTVQGKLLDACTKEPIVGAIIDIGVAQATTTETGQYTMHNVPATSFVSPTALTLLSGYSGTYSATIDLRKAKNVVTGENKYPQFTYDQVSVAFSSLAETSLAKGGTEADRNPNGAVAATGTGGIASNPNGAVVAAGAAGAGANVTTASVSVSTTNATNHDTPVTQLGNGDFDFYVGKVNTAIAGYAVTGNLRPVPAGYIVKLYSMGRNWDENSSTGGSGHLLATTTVKENGLFKFDEKYEAAQIFRVVVTDIDGDVPNFRGSALRTTACEGTTWFGSARDARAIIVSSTDAVRPFIISKTTTDSKGTSGDDYRDLDPSTKDGIKVTFNFSEKIVRTELNDGKGLQPSTIGGLYKYIYVYYEGNKANFNKAGNIAHSIKWDSDTALTVTIPVGKASVYSVSLGQEAAQLLKDESGKPLGKPWAGRGESQDFSFEYTVLDAAGNPVLDAAGNPTTGTRGFFYDSAKHNVTTLKALPIIDQIHFTTYGAAAAGQPTLTITNKNSIDYNGRVDFSWNAVSGAKYYRLYCAQNQVWGSTSNAHPMELVVDPVTGLSKITSTTYSYKPVQGFVENDSVQLTYDCYIVGVDADGLEGKGSVPVKVTDNVAPTIAGTDLSSKIGTTSFKIFFSEPLVKAAAQKIDNYTLNPDAFTGTVPKIIGAVYSEADFSVTLSLDRKIEALNMGAINTGLNGRLETVKSPGDNAVEGVVLGDGQPNSACVVSDKDGLVVPAFRHAEDLYQITPGSVANKGQVIVNSGANGRCQTTALPDMKQLLTPITPTNPNGNGTPNWVAITAAVGKSLQTPATALGGDDKISNAPVLVTVGTAVTDIATHPVNTSKNAIRTDGKIE